MKKLLLLLLLASPCFGSGAKYSYRDLEPRLDDEFDNVYNHIDSVGGGIYRASSMTLLGLTVTSITVTGTSAIHGTTTNDSAATGYIGEYIESKAVSDSLFPVSNTYDDLTSVSLTAGDWDVTAYVNANANGATTWANAFFAITTFSGNDATGQNLADNQWFESWNNITAAPVGVMAVIPAFRVSLAATTTYYLKRRAAFTGTAPITRAYRLSARRMR